MVRSRRPAGRKKRREPALALWRAASRLLYNRQGCNIEAAEVGLGVVVQKRPPGDFAGRF